MAYKLTCPTSDAYTSAVFTAYSGGMPCPYCGSGRQAASSQFYRQLPDDHTVLAPTRLSHFKCESPRFAQVRELSPLWKTEAQANTVMVGIDTRGLDGTIWSGDTVAIGEQRYKVLGIEATRTLTHPPVANPIIGLWPSPLGIKL